MKEEMILEVTERRNEERQEHHSEYFFPTSQIGNIILLY